MSEIVKPVWLPEASTYRSKPPSGGPFPLRTDEGRGAYIVEVLSETVIPSGVKELAILEVGIGIDCRPFLCAYEPYFMAAVLDKSGINYRAVLLDQDPSVLMDVAEREEICCTRNRYNGVPFVREAIDWYIRHTGVVPKEVFSIGNPSGPIKYNPRHAEEAVKEARSGLMVIGVPQSFRNKLASGHVSLVHGDIATVDLSKYSQFGFIACNNVLFYLSSAGQQLAVFNMSRALESGGILMMNDATCFGNPPVLKEIGGWLGRNELRDLGLVIDRYWHDEVSITWDGEESRFLTLRKAE